MPNRLSGMLTSLGFIVIAACGGSQPSGSATPPPADASAGTAAMQALRLMGAVQIAHFSSAKGYATPEALKKAGALDPQWPRVNAEDYRVTCEAAAEKFVCYADALRPGLPWYRIDDSQRLRQEAAARPNSESPVAGRPEPRGGTE